VRSAAVFCNFLWIGICVADSSYVLLYELLCDCHVVIPSLRVQVVLVAVLARNLETPVKTTSCITIFNRYYLRMNFRSALKSFTQMNFYTVISMISSVVNRV
jgi:hypothetical protein